MRRAFAAGREASRRVAGMRAQRRVRVPVGPETRDPMAQSATPLWRKLLALLALAAASLSVHVGGVVASKAIGDFFGHYDMDEPAPPEPIRIQVRDVPAPKVEPPAVPAAVVPAPTRPVPTPAAPVPDPIDQPPPQAQAPPSSATEPPRRRVVGLSLESTVVGGAGPAVAVGNTRMGETASTATDPAAVAKLEPAASPNRVASALPVGGARIEKPRKKSNDPPPYPETLRLQGVEADVAVLVSIDASGKVTAAEVLGPAPQAEFNEAARRAALAEVFEPATRDGVPIPYSIKVTYRFRLDEV